MKQSRVLAGSMPGIMQTGVIGYWDNSVINTGREIKYVSHSSVTFSKVSSSSTVVQSLDFLIVNKENLGSNPVFPCKTLGTIFHSTSHQVTQLYE